MKKAPQVSPQPPDTAGPTGAITVPPTLPKGGGAVRGLNEGLKSDAFTGAAGFTLPLPSTPCRDFVPDLGLDYHSGSGNGPFGVGFELSLANISRKTVLHIPTYTDEDVFVLTGSGDLVPDLADGSLPQSRAITGDDDVEWKIETFRPRNESAFDRIERWIDIDTDDTFWRVVDRDNSVHLFGRTAQARITDPSNPRHIFSWLLETSQDSRGNLISYTYKAEDGERVDTRLSEAGRDQSAQKYPLEIAYGSYVHPKNGEDQHFKIVFDYGERDFARPESLRFEAPQAWPVRSDPFSTYRAGFEIRTRRLCRGVLLFHCFPDIQNGKPQLVRTMQFDYDENPILSRLETVQEAGFRPGDKSLETIALPPTSFTYSSFEPSGVRFEPLTIEDDTQTGVIGRGPTQMIAMNGEGLPGVLYSDQDLLLYWPPLGAGAFGRPYSPAHFPLERPGDEARLLDVSGDGVPDLELSLDFLNGAYPRRPDGSWGDFLPFAGFPTETGGVKTFRVDTTGDGRSDVLLATVPELEIYHSKGLAGFTPVSRESRPPDFPLTDDLDKRIAVRFADPFGDGGSHVVRISSGKFECWPSLGYGQFGPVVTLADAPQFDGDLDPARLFLADVDGSGTADIVYAEHDRLLVFLNQSGNALSKPFDIPLPQPWSQIESLELADVNGQGTTSAVLSGIGPDLAVHLSACDFARGRKPYLLTETDDNMGAVTRVHYAPSTRFYLADQRVGRPWITRLPFPVQVVEKVENIDRITGSRQVKRFAYHDGYFDGEEREFRGFGYVESWIPNPSRALRIRSRSTPSKKE